MNGSCETSFLSPLPHRGCEKGGSSLCPLPSARGAPSGSAQRVWYRNGSSAPLSYFITICKPIFIEKLVSQDNYATLLSIV